MSHAGGENEMPKDDTEITVKLADEAVAWVASEDGRKALENTLRQVSRRESTFRSFLRDTTCSVDDLTSTTVVDG